MSRNGFIKLDALLGLYIVSLLVPLSLSLLLLSSRFSYDYHSLNDEISIGRLRKIILLSYEQDYSANSLSFTYKNKRYDLYLTNNHLILTPGTQIFLEDVEWLYFSTKNECLYLTYSREGKIHEKVLGSQKGLYLDDFLTGDDELSEHGDGSQLLPVSGDEDPDAN